MLRRYQYLTKSFPLQIAKVRAECPSHNRSGLAPYSNSSRITAHDTFTWFNLLLTTKLIHTNNVTQSDYEDQAKNLTRAGKWCLENPGSLKCSIQSQNMGSLYNESQKVTKVSLFCVSFVSKPKIVQVSVLDSQTRVSASLWVSDFTIYRPLEKSWHVWWMYMCIHTAL